MVNILAESPERARTDCVGMSQRVSSSDYTPHGIVGHIESACFNLYDRLNNLLRSKQEKERQIARRRRRIGASRAANDETIRSLQQELAEINSSSEVTKTKIRQIGSIEDDPNLNGDVTEVDSENEFTFPNCIVKDSVIQSSR
jgi:hypothetical protein